MDGSSRIPKKVSQEKYLVTIAEKMELKKLITASSSKKLIFGKEKSNGKFFHVNFQRINSLQRKEFVRKYFFLVDNKVAVMTILSFQKPNRNTYSSFETFIKKLG